ncbi:hypothetical protein, partial [Arthrobacter sp. DR-2P]
DHSHRKCGNQIVRREGLCLPERVREHQRVGSQHPGDGETDARSGGGGAPLPCRVRVPRQAAVTGVRGHRADGEPHQAPRREQVRHRLRLHRREPRRPGVGSEIYRRVQHQGAGQNRPAAPEAGLYVPAGPRAERDPGHPQLPGRRI